ncbi:MAG: NAAT family transporter [Anaerolineales bacterium]|jgi:multiple antibiotic resistance protein|uniref:MarC family protein n=1 Tax=Candidatus Villigracilis proximus TaxID=3140683 RepID=UPI0031372BEE|nr:NAAT family transporter [Anaerolineales bacterium]MBK8823323.1 NAAT family transporter [Anaerolineales bacterium]MBK9208993.1 NAAT family transporter [Anaerolineales bacterium]
MTASPLFEFALLSFISMFTMVNPVGVIPVFTAMTAKLSPQESHRVARKASLTALFILLAFALTGQWIFRFFSISVNSLRVVGGVIFFLMGYEMLQAHLSRTQFDDETNHAYINDISITPLGIPIICGPGAITTSILLMNETKTPLEVGIVVGIIVLLIAITYILLLGAKQVTRLIGENGNKVMLRLMGLIVMVIAVEFFFSGLTPIVREMLKIQ